MIFFALQQAAARPGFVGDQIPLHTFSVTRRHLENAAASFSPAKIA
jgi:hypothetical protein